MLGSVEQIDTLYEVLRKLRDDKCNIKPCHALKDNYK